jgi:RIO kinase 2
MGLDYLAMRVFVNRGTIAGVGRRIGVGKESDIYECVSEQGEIMAMKIHRLGRVSFKNVKSKRDYLLHRKSASWMYMSRLAAVREYTFMQVYSNQRHLKGS